MLNITEGSDRGTDKDFNRLLVNALGSLNESVATLDMALVNKYISKVTFDKLIVEATSLSNQLVAFSKKLKGNSKSQRPVARS